MEYCKKQVKSDCEELLSRFRLTNSVRFEDFCKIWRNMKFSEIFYGLTVGQERRVFSRQILDTACSFFLPPFNFQIRVGGLYLLYSLYHSQTGTTKEQIRLTLKHWEDVKKFERDSVGAEHLDVVYILRRLLFLKAFHFTAMPKLLKYRQTREVERLVVSEDFIERTSRPQELVSVNLLEELSNIHDHYKQLKDSTLPTAQPDLSLSLIHDDLLPQLRNIVVDFHKWQKDKGASLEEDDDSGEGTSTQEECSRRAELLKSIKSKSYGQAVEASRSRRHRQVEMDFTSDQAGAEERLFRRKLSLKGRTNQNVHIKGDVKQETIKCTKLWKLATPDSVPEDLYVTPPEPALPHVSYNNNHLLTRTSTFFTKNMWQ
ncbi:snRNA-activating protein complex subunit 1b [Diretmus argenteus]